MPLPPGDSPTGSSPYSGGSGGGGSGSGSAPPQGFTDALNLYGAYYGPQMTTLQNQYNSQSFRPYQAIAAYGDQSSALNQQYQAQLAGLGLDRQGNALEQASLSRQSGYYDQLAGLDSGDYTRNVAYQNALKGFLGSSYQVTTGVHKDVLSQLADAASQARFTAGRDVRQSDSASTAAGAFTSQGHRDDLGDIESIKDYALSDIGHKTKQENLGYLQSTINRDRESAGIDNTIASLTSDFSRSKLTTAEQKARLGDRQAQLGLQAQRYGVQADIYAAQLQQGLASLDLNQVLTVGQLMDAMSLTNQQQQQLAMQIMQQAYQAGTTFGG